jgi:hypothetical protein
MFFVFLLQLELNKMIKTYKRSGSKLIKRQLRERQNNYLKYWRIVKYYIKRKYDISSMEEDFNYYGNTMSWDKKRFYEMVKKDLIKEWRPGGEKYGRAKLWELSHKGKTICSLTYKKLNQEEPISEEPRSNPIFKKENYMDKVYKNVIKGMNKARDRSNKQ